MLVKFVSYAGEGGKSGIKFVCIFGECREYSEWFKEIRVGFFFGLDVVMFVFLFENHIVFHIENVACGVVDTEEEDIFWREFDDVFYSEADGLVDGSF